MLMEITVKRDRISLLRDPARPEKYLVSTYQRANEEICAIVAAHPDKKGVFSSPINRAEEARNTALEQHPSLKGRSHGEVTWLITFWFQTLAKLDADPYAINSLPYERLFAGSEEEAFGRRFIQVSWPAGANKTPDWSHAQQDWHADALNALEEQAKLKGFAVPTREELEARYETAAADFWERKA